MAGRRMPRPSEVLPLIGRRDRTRTALQRRLDRCASVWDVRSMARRRAPRAVFDYTDGAAMSEASLVRSRDAYRRVEFTPRVLRDVAQVDLSVDILGQRSALPFVFAPTGFTRMMHHSGEPAVAAVAADKGIPYGLSTLGTTSIEDLAHACPDARRWFQLYVSRDRGSAEDLMRRAGENGYDTLILTVDTAVGGVRRREVRHGLTIPPQLGLSTMAEMARHPRWWFDVLTTEPLTFASLSSTGGTVGDLLTRVFDPGVTGAEITWIRENWSGKVMLKGIQSRADAELAADLGVDAIVLSNHGGRQVDMGNVPLELLPEVVAAVGDHVEVYIDGGIMSGTDIVAALAFGARATLVGRAYLYGLMAGGEDGVRRVAEILEKEVRTTMQLIGTRTVDEARTAEVRLRGRP
ncbi:MAG: alpha-hydroxy acid oxidase [Actinomycetota bacterium]|nr:alpha-hydroxy acid oxidase [Actinomycetota bacterium]